MNRLVIGNLLHRPLRSGISIFAVAIEVAMILSIVGILFGQIEGSRRQTSGIGADLIVRPPNASFIAGVSGAPVPAKVANVIGQLPHVAVASPAIQQLSVKTSVETIWGIDYASYNALRPFVFLSGGPFKGPNDVIVDDIFARTGHHYVVGDTIPVLDHPFRICGIVEHGKGGRKYLPIRTLGALLGAEDNASIIFVKSDDPKNEQLIEQEIHAHPGMSEYQVQTLAESLSQMTPEHLPAFTDALYTVIGLAVVVGFIVIFQAMYTAVLERTREIGILKSLGASQTYIVDLVLRETAFLSIVGIILGIAITFLLKKVMDVRFPTIPFPIDAHWLIAATLIALGGSLVGATYPALKAARKDPIEALAYE
ncbi:MAG TPA: FtsX-like permease family protein [Acidobacteriaceae bacterium]|jgi:putative ABC transport system permease protein|nr:FtsX-like permease family protein [Acidobacteriaceae bacterium]